MAYFQTARLVVIVQPFVFLHFPLQVRHHATAQDVAYKAFCIGADVIYQAGMYLVIIMNEYMNV